MNVVQWGYPVAPMEPGRMHAQSKRWGISRAGNLGTVWRLGLVCMGLHCPAMFAQTHPHPAVPPQPKPAGSTPASGAGAAPASPADAAPASSEHATTHNHDATGHGAAGHEMAMAFGPIADTQEASGTSWQPAETSMHAQHSMLGDWMVMTHYNAFLGYDHQSGARGDDQFNSINWLMLMAARRTESDDLGFRTMLSLEPWTTTTRGYPLLFQTGESYHGQPLVDRQHPHDFFMELSGRYRRLIERDTVLSLYIAPAGEPALGPPAFMHRASAMDNPASPISHHWLDSTHISFGVVTAGVAQKAWQLEGSWFNGREPDEDRWGIDLSRLDSYSGRFTWNPTPQLSAQVSVGYLKSPEELHPREDLWRTTASIMHTAKIGRDDHIATTLAWGRNDQEAKTNAVLLESSCTRALLTCFARAEYVQKTCEDLNLQSRCLGHGPGVSQQKFAIKQLTVGATHELVEKRPWQLALGGSVGYSWISGELKADYGHPIGYWIFLRLRPAAMGH